MFAISFGVNSLLCFRTSPLPCLGPVCAHMTTPNSLSWRKRCTWLPRPGANLWWVPLQGVDNQATAPAAGDIHELCLSCHRVAGIPPVDPRVTVFESMYNGGRPAWTTNRLWGWGNSAIFGIFGETCYYHWAAMAAMESYVVHRWMSVFWAGEPGVVPEMGCKY